MSFRKTVRPHQVMSIILGATFCLSLAAFAGAQTFSTGSTGADGPLDFSNVPSGTTVVFDPAKFNPPLNPAGDNIFNFTTINIPPGVTVRLSGRILHGPVIWLATGDVHIDGTLDLNGENGAGPATDLASRTRAMPGAGGFSGGVGGKCDPAATGPQPLALPGDGPLGGPAGQCSPGNASFGSPAAFSANANLIPIVGGSGGGGATNVGNPGGGINFAYHGGGGAGGGAILIASPTIIRVDGTIQANGGAATNSPAGGGAGGGIRLVAPTLFSDRFEGLFSAKGGDARCCSSPAGADGFIRLDTFNDQVSHSFNNTPFEIGSTLAVFPPTIPPPSITVTAVNGQPVVQPPTGSPIVPDVVINSGSPVTITIQATNIPVNTVLTLHAFSDNNTDQTVQTTPLQGSFQSSTATATLTFPGGFSLNFLRATWKQ